MGPPNPEVIAWYVEEAQRLLDDQQRRAESLRTRGSQVAGFGAAVLALIVGNAPTILEASEGSAQVAVGLMLLAGAFSLVAAVALAIWGVMRPGSLVVVGADESPRIRRSASSPSPISGGFSSGLCMLWSGRPARLRKTAMPPPQWSPPPCMHCCSGLGFRSYHLVRSPPS